MLNSVDMNEAFNPPRKNSETTPIDNRSEAEKETGFHKEERKWHEGRWKRKAEAANKTIGENKTFKNFLRDDNHSQREEKNPDDFMREEAERDDIEFENRKHENYEKWEEMLKPVKENFKEKAENPENSEIKTLIIILGGGMKSAQSAGQIVALNMMGITADKMDAVVGASGGTTVAAAYVGGVKQTLSGTSMLTGPMSSKEFIDPSISRFRSGDIINIPMINKLMRDKNGPYTLNEEAIRDSETELSFIMTLPGVEKGESDIRFVDAKKLDSIPDGISASMGIPWISGEIPKIDGVTYYDGALNALPINEILERFPDTTDVIILPQNPYTNIENIKPTLMENIAGHTAGAATLNLLKKGLHSSEEYREGLQEIQEIKHVRIGVLWPPDAELGVMTTDGDTLKAGIIAAARDTIEQFGGEQPKEIPVLGQNNINEAPSEDEDGQEAV